MHRADNICPVDDAPGKAKMKAPHEQVWRRGITV
jgi:hypothetical protein